METPVTVQQPSLTVADVDGDWSIARVKSRQEKVFADELHRRSIGYYMPLRQVFRWWGGRRRSVLVPVFDGIVFVGNGGEGYDAAADSRCVFGFIPVATRYQPVLRGELINLERLLAAKPDIETFPHLPVGREVVIRPGHRFVGVRGIIESRGAQSRFWVRVQMLGQSIPMEIDPAYLEPVESEAV